MGQSMDTQRGVARPAAAKSKKKTPSKKATLKKATRETKARQEELAPAIASAVRTVEIETRALGQLADALRGRLAGPFSDAVTTLQKTAGRVIVTGMGKSGHVGQKIAATFASTGTPAFFVHPSEASHGDLGMVTRDDVLLALSWSGETVELSNILTYARRFGVPLISITSSAKSALGRASDIVLQLPAVEEACPHGLAPTATTTMQLAVGDSLAVALLEARGFTAHDFKVFHPGGSLGAQLKLVEDIMHSGDSLPITPVDTRMPEALLIMTQKAFGCVGVVDAKGKLVGVVTDGDLRRHMGEALFDATVSEVMTRRPKTISRKALTSTALDQLNSSRITSLFVVEKTKPVGILHIHDLLRIGVA